ncbi:MAG TPA: hypothetical protein VGO29_00990 [Solirubrobacteraceae bacterium]|nr:hypothetical protein [Solirubrobacteraceae bacterium]
MRAWTTRRWPVAVALVSMAALACCAVASHSSDLLCVLPALLLACPLLARRYPGERALVALRGKRSESVRWPRARSASSRRARAIVVVVHGGLLIGRSLAVRPPPAPSRALA